MEKILNTLADLKHFLSLLTDEQLQQPVRICEVDKPYKKASSIEMLEEDYINPTGEMAEKLSDYLPGGQFWEAESEDEMRAEEIVASHGFVFLNLSE